MKRIAYMIHPWESGLGVEYNRTHAIEFAKFLINNTDIIPIFTPLCWDSPITDNVSIDEIMKWNISLLDSLKAAVVCGDRPENWTGHCLEEINHTKSNNYRLDLFPWDIAEPPDNEYWQHPRDQDNLGTLIAFHKRYYLDEYEDNTEIKDIAWHFLEYPISAPEEIERLYPDYNKLILEEPIKSPAKAFEKWMDINEYLYHRVYLYDHSGLRISVYPFSSSWDSGLLGWIVVPFEKVRDTFGVSEITDEIREKALGCLEEEIQTYDRYLWEG